MSGLGRQRTEMKIMEIVVGMFQNSAEYDQKRVINTGTRIRDELGFDSVMLIVLQIDIEDAFQIRFDPAQEGLQQIFTSVRTLTDYVQSHIGE